MNACSQLVMKRFNLLYSSCPPFENPFLINGFLKGGSRPFLPLRIKKDDCVFVLFFFLGVGGWVGAWTKTHPPPQKNPTTKQKQNSTKTTTSQQIWSNIHRLFIISHWGATLAARIARRWRFLSDSPSPSAPGMRGLPGGDGWLDEFIEKKHLRC